MLSAACNWSIAIEIGENVVIGTVLSSEGKAVDLGARLVAAGYDIEVVDVEVAAEVSRERIRSRSEQSYVAALEGGDPMGGRWVPSEYANEVFDGAGGLSRPEVAARALAEQCPAVTRYRVFRSTNAPVGQDTGVPAAETDLSRRISGGPMMETDLLNVVGIVQASRPAGRRPGRDDPGAQR